MYGQQPYSIIPHTIHSFEKFTFLNFYIIKSSLNQISSRLSILVKISRPINRGRGFSPANSLRPSNFDRQTRWHSVQQIYSKKTTVAFHAIQYFKNVMLTKHCAIECFFCNSLCCIHSEKRTSSFQGPSHQQPTIHFT